MTFSFYGLFVFNFVARFVSFIAGSFAAVLLLATVLDPDLFLNFEITPHRTVFFYLGVFGAILTVTRGMIPEDNRVFDPEILMAEVITYTHYMPDSWKGQLHSKRVSRNSSPCICYRSDFSGLAGTSRVRWALRDKNPGFCSRTPFCYPNTIRTVVLLAGLCASDH